MILQTDSGNGTVACYFSAFEHCFVFAFKCSGKWLNKICKLPLIGTANTVLGGVFGILKGLIAVYFIGIILLLLSANSKQNTSFYEAVNNSAIITIIQNHSVVPIG